MADFFKDVRTDLAIESVGGFTENESRPGGVEISETEHEYAHVHVTHVFVKNKTGAEALKKPVGHYITIECPYMDRDDESFHREISEVLREQIHLLVPEIRYKKVLVAGIGNRNITPDAIGPLTVDHLFVTRHLTKELGKEHELVKNHGCVSAIAPGVMAQTGMEGLEILRSLVRETQPDIVIIADALAARSMGRLNKTIQLTDTGICPGSGVGNQRQGLTRETLGVPVIAIGIPTVIDAAAIAAETTNRLFELLKNEHLFPENVSFMEHFSMEEQYLIMKELMAPEMEGLFVTPKDIDETVRRLSFMISEAINELCHEND